jgi:amino-acid N-acetyltransferase
MTSLRAARPQDLPAITALLTRVRLPLAGVDEHIGAFVVAERDGEVVGCAGLERYGAAALLRSVAVAPAARGAGLGARLTRACLDAAQTDRVEKVALLTETAEGFFPRFGFVPIPRTAVPEALQASAELRGACPASARAMLLNLGRAASDR